MIDENDPRITPVKHPYREALKQLKKTMMGNIAGIIGVIFIGILMAILVSYFFWIGYYKPKYNVGYFDYLKVGLEFLQFLKE